jgi:hypothetical protein
MGKNPIVAEMIKSLFVAQRFAVLATESGGQPYSNLVAFAETDDLKNLVFVTNRNSRKYTNTRVNNRVAMLVDNRTNQPSDLDKAAAITALGTIGEVMADYYDALSRIYLAKHPRLDSFLGNPSNALMSVAVRDYIVATFEGVRHLSIEEI